MSVVQRGTSPKRRQVRPVDSVPDPRDLFARLCTSSGRPMLSRVDPYQSLILTRADMPQFISELEAEFGECDDPEVSDLLRRVLGLARQCQARAAHEIHLDGD
jgi:hypothetical protein